MPQSRLVHGMDVQEISLVGCSIAEYGHRRLWIGLRQSSSESVGPFGGRLNPCQQNAYPCDFWLLVGTTPVVPLGRRTPRPGVTLPESKSVYIPRESDLSSDGVASASARTMCSIFVSLCD